MEYFIGGFLLCFAILWMVYAVLNNKILKIEEKFNKYSAGDDETISSLITEFNHVSNVNIHLLEERIKELKTLVNLANEKIRRMNMMMSDMELLASRLQQKNHNTDKALPLPGFQKAYILHKQGKNLEEISSELSISQDEVKLSLELAEKKFAS